MSERDLFFCSFFYWFLCLLYCRFFAGTRIVLMRIKFGDAINIKDCHITARISGTPQLVGNLSVLQAQEGRHKNFRSPPHCELPRARFFEEKNISAKDFILISSRLPRQRCNLSATFPPLVHFMICPCASFGIHTTCKLHKQVKMHAKQKYITVCTISSRTPNARKLCQRKSGPSRRFHRTGFP